MRNVRTVRDCQTSCDNEDACAAYRYDDEQQTCALHPSRSPNTYVGPNSLYCVQAVGRSLVVLFFRVVKERSLAVFTFYRLFFKKNNCWVSEKI